MGDLTEYIFSPVCGTTALGPGFTCPGSGSMCLHPLDATFDTNSQPDWKVHSDGATSDFLFNYGEVMLHLEAFKDSQSAIAVTPNPCQTDGDPGEHLNGDADVDGFRNGVERYITTSHTQKCAANTVPLNEAVDSQPSDNNDDKRTNLSDVSRVGAVYNSALGLAT